MAASNFDSVTVPDLELILAMRARQVKIAERRLMWLRAEMPETMEELRRLRADEARWKERLTRRQRRLKEIDDFLKSFRAAIAGRAGGGAAAPAAGGGPAPEEAPPNAPTGDVEMNDTTLDAEGSESEEEEDGVKAFAPDRQIVSGNTILRVIGRGSEIHVLYMDKKRVVSTDGSLHTPLELARTVAPLVATRWWRHVEYLGADGNWHSMRHMEA